MHSQGQQGDVRVTEDPFRAEGPVPHLVRKKARRPPHGRPRDPRVLPAPPALDDEEGRRGDPFTRPSEQGLHRRCAQQEVGRGHHLREDVAGLRARRLRARPLLPKDRGVVDGRSPPHRAGAGRARHGGAWPSARRWAHPSLRPLERSQYTSVAFGKRCREAGIVSSMGSVGDAYDNAAAESFIATLKCELIYRRSWPTRDQAELAMFDFIEAFYNPRRRHTTNGFLSPVAFEDAYAKETVLA